MTRDWLSDLVCPRCRKALEISDSLVCRSCGHAYPVTSGIPRFVTRDNYASSFGLQWNLHRRTQHDTASGTTISRDRLYGQSGWTKDELRGHRVLECGCGAGRFTEVLCESGAEVYSLDLSNAVDANHLNNGRFPNLHLVQASVYEIPFPDAFFDYLVCFGMIQHTPDVGGAFKAMFRCLARGGRFALDVYASPIAYFHPRHLLRPFTKRLPQPVLYRAVEKAVPLLLPVSTRLHALPWVGELAARLIPVANWRKNLSLPTDALWREWAVLDTFDWLSPAFEFPQPRRRLRRWGQDLGLAKMDLRRARGLFVMSGVR